MNKSRVSQLLHERPLPLWQRNEGLLARITIWTGDGFHLFTFRNAFWNLSGLATCPQLLFKDINCYYFYSIFWPILSNKDYIQMGPKRG